MTARDWPTEHAARLAELAAHAPPLFHQMRHGGGRKSKPVVTDRGERWDSVRDAAEAMGCSYDAVRLAIVRRKRLRGRAWKYEGKER